MNALQISGGGSVAIGAEVIGATAGQLLYVGAGPVLADSANLRFNPTGSLLTLGTDAVVSRYAAKQIMISGDGTGATTNAGVIVGYAGASNTWALGGCNAAPSTTEYAIQGRGDNSILYLRATNDFRIVDGAGLKLQLVGTAGSGPLITAGTATTDVNALSLTQTWNGGAVAFRGIRQVITSTARAAGSLDLSLERSTGQGIGIDQLDELTTIAAAATTDTTIQIPANVIVLGVSVRVTTVIPTAATFTVIGTTSSTAFQTGANVSTAATTTDAGTKSCPYLNTTAQTIRITPNAQPADNSGRVRVTIHYIKITPPTS